MYCPVIRLRDCYSSLTHFGKEHASGLEMARIACHLAALAITCLATYDIISISETATWLACLSIASFVFMVWQNDPSRKNCIGNPINLRLHKFIELSTAVALFALAISLQNAITAPQVSFSVTLVLVLINHMGKRIADAPR